MDNECRTVKIWEPVQTVANMTLRDWFAGQALAGMMSDMPPQVDERQIADAAYKLADAMLKAREVKP